MNDDEFDKLLVQERMEAVDERMGGIHPDRIRLIQELIDLRGETIYIILSPFGQEQDIGNGFIYEWKVGNVTTPDRVPVTSFNQDDADGVKLICEFLVDEDVEYRAISIKDFNIIPNNHNNHCMFTTLEGAEAYAIYRKLKWSEDENLTEIKDEYPFWMLDKKTENE